MPDRTRPSPYSSARRASVFCVVLILLGVMIRPASAQGGADREYDLKAAFLYNFTKFVEWPPAKFARADSPIVIGVLGRNPFGNSLAAAVKGRKVNQRPIIVRVVRQPSEVAGLHVLFVPAAETNRAAGMADIIRRSAVLAVGETPAFLDSGGSISFFREADKVRFDINLRTAEASQLRISAQLLKLARNVRRSR